MALPAQNPEQGGEEPTMRKGSYVMKRTRDPKVQSSDLP